MSKFNQIIQTFWVQLKLLFPFFLIPIELLVSNYIDEKDFSAIVQVL